MRIQKSDFKVNIIKIVNKTHLAQLVGNKRYPIILMYHGVTDDSSLAELFWTQVNKTKFISQMEYIKEFYSPVPLNLIVDHARVGCRPQPRSVAVTFDDGYENNYSIGKPILESLKIPATFFCVTNFIGTDNLLWTDRLRIYVQKVLEDKNRKEKILRKIDRLIVGYGNTDFKNIDSFLKRIPFDLKNEVISLIEDELDYCATAGANPSLRGMELNQVSNLENSGLFNVGAHTVSHEVLTQCPYEEVRRQVIDSVDKLSDITNSKITLFSYPNGNHNRDIQNIIKQAGCVCGLTTEAESVREKINPYALPRIGVGSDLTSTIDHFKLALTGAVPEGSLNPYKIMRGYAKRILPKWLLNRISCYPDKIRANVKKVRYIRFKIPHNRFDEFIKMNRPLKNIQFVCQGNICRSAFASVYFSSYSENKGIKVASSGIWAREGRRAELLAIDSAFQFGISLKEHRAQKTNSRILQEADAIFCFEKWHILASVNIYPKCANKIFSLSAVNGKHYSIEDPYGGGIDEFEKTFQIISDLIRTLIRKLNVSEPEKGKGQYGA